MDILGSIISRRAYTLPKEPFASIVFVLCSIDAAALVSCSGQGALIIDAISTNLLPTGYHLESSPPLLPNEVNDPSIMELFEPTFDFMRDLLVLFTGLGQTSRNIRQELEQQREHAQLQGRGPLFTVDPATITHWHQQAIQLRQAIKQKYNSQLPPALAAVLGHQQSLPVQIRQIYEQVSYPRTIGQLSKPLMN